MESQKTAMHYVGWTSTILTAAALVIAGIYGFHTLSFNAGQRAGSREAHSELDPKVDELTAKLTARNTQLAEMTTKFEVALAATRFFSEGSPRAKEVFGDNGYGGNTYLYVCKNDAYSASIDELTIGKAVNIHESQYQFQTKICTDGNPEKETVKASIPLVKLLGTGWQLQPEMILTPIGEVTNTSIQRR